MESHKFSVSVPEQLFKFVEKYQKEHSLRTRSEVIGRALQQLQNIELEKQYQQANEEIEEAFDILSGDGLEDETW